MKLTKAIVDILKYHGYVTFTESTETFLKRFDTVEDLSASGFITDRGAIDFLDNTFDENGVNRSAEVSEVELEKQAEIIESEVVTPETIISESIESVVVASGVVEPESVTNIEESVEISTETSESSINKIEAPAEPSVVPEVEKPKPTKKSTTKKTIKKES